METTSFPLSGPPGQSKQAKQKNVPNGKKRQKRTAVWRCTLIGSGADTLSSPNKTLCASPLFLFLSPLQTNHTPTRVLGNAHPSPLMPVIMMLTNRKKGSATSPNRYACPEEAKKTKKGSNLHTDQYSATPCRSQWCHRFSENVSEPCGSIQSRSGEGGGGTVKASGVWGGTHRQHVCPSQLKTHVAPRQNHTYYIFITIYTAPN